MNNGDQILEELFRDPETFDQQGRAYQLLQAYFGGFPHGSLRELLASENKSIQRVAVWIASELGEEARTLADDVIPLLDKPDRYVQYHAAEVLTACATGRDARKFLHVIQLLEDRDEGLRRMVMRLVSGADRAQLEAGAEELERASDHSVARARGLKLLLTTPVDAGEIQRMMDDEDPLLRRFSAIAARRSFGEHPELLRASALSVDADVRGFAESALVDCGSPAQ